MGRVRDRAEHTASACAAMHLSGRMALASVAARRAVEHHGATRRYPESTVAYGVIGHYSAIVADFSPNGISIVVFLYLEVEVKLITIHRNSMYFNLSLQRKL